MPSRDFDIENHFCSNQDADSPPHWSGTVAVTSLLTSAFSCSRLCAVCWAVSPTRCSVAGSPNPGGRLVRSAMALPDLPGVGQGGHDLPLVIGHLLVELPQLGGAVPGVLRGPLELRLDP